MKNLFPLEDLSRLALTDAKTFVVETIEATIDLAKKPSVKEMYREVLVHVRGCDSKLNLERIARLANRIYRGEFQDTSGFLAASRLTIWQLKPAYPKLRIYEPEEELPGTRKPGQRQTLRTSAVENAMVTHSNVRDPGSIMQ
ncbi:hypothetical protein KJ758_03340 [Patescibacteria group bacterium]|nr:hypothetical protein [Patescibacteria group bacterium]